MARPQTDRPYAKDFLAGVDPTGQKTFMYGLQDVPKSEEGRAARRAIGVAGGLVGGGLVVPAVISALVSAARKAPGGWRSAGKGFLTGLQRPNIGVYRAIKSGKIIGKIQQGASITKAEIQHLKNFSKNIPMAEHGAELAKKLAPEVARLTKMPVLRKPTLWDRIKRPLELYQAGKVMDKFKRTGSIKSLSTKERNLIKDLVSDYPVQKPIVDKIKRLAKQHGISESEYGVLALYALPKDILSKIQGTAYGEAAQAAAALTISGIIGGGSAYFQYGKGGKVGKHMTKGQRQAIKKEGTVLAGLAGARLAFKSRDELEKIAIGKFDTSYLITSALANILSKARRPAHFVTKGLKKTRSGPAKIAY